LQVDKVGVRKEDVIPAARDAEEPAPKLVKPASEVCDFYAY